MSHPESTPLPRGPKQPIAWPLFASSQLAKMAMPAELSRELAKFSPSVVAVQVNHWSLTGSLQTVGTPLSVVPSVLKGRVKPETVQLAPAGDGVMGMAPAQKSFPGITGSLSGARSEFSSVSILTTEPWSVAIGSVFASTPKEVHSSSVISGLFIFASRQSKGIQGRAASADT